LISQFEDGFNDNHLNELLKDQPFFLVDTFQGMHPEERHNQSGHTCYPLAKCFESNNDPTKLRLIWEISEHTIITENLTLTYLKKLKNSVPKAIWIQGTFNPIIDNNAIVIQPVAAAPTSFDSDKTEWIDFSKPDWIVDVLKEEALVAERLKVLYKEPFKYPYLEIEVGGQHKRVNGFHYTDNPEAPFNSKRLEYIDLKEERELYRWELKAIVTTRLEDPITGKVETRVFYSQCLMVSPVTTDQYILGEVTTTMCVENLNHFFVMKVGTTNIERWDRFDIIKKWYCIPDAPIDVNSYFEVFFKYCDKARYFYDKSRMVNRNTKHPGNLSVTDSKV